MRCNSMTNELRKESNASYQQGPERGESCREARGLDPFHVFTSLWRPSCEG